MGIDDEKASFLKAIENEAIEKNIKEAPPEPRKGSPLSGVAIFASLFISFLFIIVLLIFVMAISPGNNPILQSIGVEASRVKEFLLSLVDNTFLVLTIFLMLLFSIGIFRGFSLPKDGTPKKKRAFLFGAVSGALIFLVVLAWLGSSTFIQKFVVSPSTITIAIEMQNAPVPIIAPIDLQFSADKIAKSLQKKGKKIIFFKWDKDNDGIFEVDRGRNSDVTIHFDGRGKQMLGVQVGIDGEEPFVSKLEFQIADAIFRVSPSEKGPAPFTPEFDASLLIKAKSARTFSWDYNGDGNFEEEVRSPKTTHLFEKTGTYSIGLRIEYEDGDIENFKRDIVVTSPGQKAVVSLIKILPDVVGVAPFEATFSGAESSTVSGKITQYAWNFGDGGPVGSGMTTKKVFEKAGTYVVKLEVKNSDGLTAESTVNITVTASKSAPTAALTTNPEAKEGVLKGTTPFEVAFDASKSIDPDDDIISYEWFFGDKETPEETGAKMRHTFRDPGETTVKLKVTDSENHESILTVKVVVDAPPIFADFDIQPETGIVPLNVTFDASKSTCRKEDCKILSFEWDYGDSSEKEITGAHASHQYQEVGTFTIKLKVITDGKETAIAEKVVSVRTPPLQSCFKSSRTKGAAPLLVSFDPTCSQGDIKKYAWDFGDGIVSEQRKPNHTFEKAGKYTVTLSIFDEKKRVGEYSDTITVE